MDDQRINEIIAALREIEPPGESHSQIVRGVPAGYIFAAANRSGFISIARACLEAAVQPINEIDGRSKPITLPESHEQMFEGPHDLVLQSLQRMETWPEPLEIIEQRRRRTRASDRATMLGCVVAILLFVALIISIMSLFSSFGV